MTGFVMGWAGALGDDGCSECGTPLAGSTCATCGQRADASITVGWDTQPEAVAAFWQDVEARTGTKAAG